MLIKKITCLGLFCFICFGFNSCEQNSKKIINKPVTTNENVVKIGGDFTLQDSAGEYFILSKNLQKKYALVFFGYSTCPTICPKALTNILTVINENKQIAKNFQPIFITLNPKKDTSEVLKEFSGNFENKILMLTGEQEQIKKIASDYKIYYADNKKTGEIDHSSIIYIIDRKGNYIDHATGDSVQQLNDKLRQVLNSK